MSVKAILNEKGRKVVTVAPQATVGEAAQLLSANRIGAVVVLDGERIVGLMAERDVVAAIAASGGACLGEPVDAHMSRDVPFCAEESEIEALMEVMNNRRARHLPVERNGRLVGIVSIGDAVRAHIRAIEHEAAQIKAYIAG